MIKPSRRWVFRPYRLSTAASLHIDHKESRNVLVPVLGHDDNDNSTSTGISRNGVAPRTRVVRWLLPLLFLLALAGQAHADGVADDCVRSGGTSDYYQYFPATTAYLGRDAAVGDVVGPWITASASPAWTCTRRSAYAGTAVQVSAQGYPPYTLLGTVSYDGQTYGYYRLGDTSGALAYIARWRVIVDGQPTDWTPLTVAAITQQNPNSYATVTKAAGDIYRIVVETQIRFVKRTSALVAGYRQNIVDPIYVRHYQRVGSSTSEGSNTYRISQMTASTATFLGGGTCTTPDVNVQLQDAPVSGFSGVGSTSLPTPFSLSFNNCPPGLASIGYRFNATTSVLNQTAGVVALDNTSTASGVGIQLSIDQTSSGTYVPVNFSNGVLYNLSSYDSGNTASYTVPMQAAYYQTANTMGAGSVSTAVTFTLNYK